jgi:hypothetical protein
MNEIIDMPIDEYHAHFAISRSTFLEFKRSPLHFQHKYFTIYQPKVYTSPVLKSDALSMGNAVHTHILENSEFEKRYVVWRGGDMKSKARREAFAEFNKEHFDQIVISESLADVIEKMAISVENSPEATALLRNGQAEKSIFFEDVDTELKFKARPDVLHDDFIVDLKTSRNASMDFFAREIYEKGYHIQAAMQCEAMKVVAGKEINDFLFVVVEKEPPYALAIYPLDPLALEAGREEFNSLKIRLKECFEKDEWPSYQTDYASLPHWAINKINEQLNKV